MKKKSSPSGHRKKKADILQLEKAESDRIVVDYCNKISLGNKILSATNTCVKQELLTPWQVLAVLEVVKNYWLNEAMGNDLISICNTRKL